VKAPARAPSKPQTPSILPQFGRLLDGKGPSRKPLIASGPKASHARPLGMHADDGASKPVAGVVKTHLSDEQLESYRQLLLHKRAVLLGDVTAIERGALDSGSGALSNMPSHLAEQGSETYDQSLSLDLAAVDRKLIREIDAALERINNRTYGVCEISGKPISQERLKELPWARYTIEAAREVERQSMRG
jgi:RNA polymerase-binding transcription factor DksA